MTKWVYTFGDGAAEGHAGDRNTLGGKGANLAEMCRLGLPVPPGFTITTELCNWYYANGNAYPPALTEQVSAALDHIAGLTGRRFGDPAKLLLVSVRSGARASMPGMMDTVLNLGLNDETVEALAADSGDARFAYDSYRRFIQMYSDVVLGRRPRGLRGDPRGREGAARPRTRHRAFGRRLAGGHRALQGEGRGGTRKAVSAGPPGAALGRHWRRLFELDEPARRHLPPPARHSRELGHCRQRAGDGVRQYGRHFRHRRRLHAQSRRPARRRFTASSLSTPRARTWSPASARRRTSPRWRASTRGPTSRRCRRSCRRPSRPSSRSRTGSKSTTATCRTSNSPSSAASSGCCRPARASAPRRRR